MPTREELIRDAATKLREAESSVRVLRALSWPVGVRQRFIEDGARALPVIEYPRFDADPVLRQLDAALAVSRVACDGDAVLNGWFERQAGAIGDASRMLAAVGTPAFFEHGSRLYGRPDKAPWADDGQQAGTPLGLAKAIQATCSELDHLDLGAPSPACHLADEVASRMRAAVRERFGDAAPEVAVVEGLSANALAGPRAIRIRRDACFSDRDIVQLIEHEAFVHVCTSLNGRAQAALPILGAGHAGTTRTQEGLAVFAEFITGVLDPHRFQRLAFRVLAIQMAIEGADFLEVYRFFLDRGVEAEQAFENARRTFRGGVLTGGAPFAKDVVYLDGLLRVTNFLRAAVAEGRSDCILLLFCGKLDIDDLPALARLASEGLCRPPRFLPRWLEDRRFLVTFLTFSRVLNGINLESYRTRSRELLDQMPRLTRFGSAPVEPDVTVERHQL